ncbi:ferrous iron transport protein A [Nostoc sp. FACHB-87]|uniref:FeoA family protein n=1 Tax=Nostocaceae TaxID=1162 RepID=UPI00168334CF|nr:MULTISPECIES: FeoA family protein [Nostocaceae]MBD2454332.1 ferrous iron transport protein A [Nostoc sp. FACHB-87]MBD2474075.1 ferrous iron transport protein A [Anabaena sp. FACHB-83]
MFKPFSVSGCSLALLQPGEQGIIAFYQTQDQKILDQIHSAGIKIGTCITLEQQLPLLQMKVAGESLSLSQEVAQTIYVRIVDN